MPKSEAIFHDSGANRHVFHSRSAFSKYTAIDPVTVNGFGKGHTTSAVGKGTVDVTSIVNGVKSHITLTNCLHIPSARANLLSQIRMDKHGVTAVIGKKQITLYRNGEPFVKGHAQNELYKLDLAIVRTSNQENHDAVVMNTLANSNGSGFYTASWGT